MSYFNLKDLEHWTASKLCSLEKLHEMLDGERRQRARKIIEAEIARREKELCSR